MEQNNQQQFKCTGDCFKCQPLQRQYCAAQWSYNCIKMLEGMQKSIAAMQCDVAELKSKIAAMQGNDETLFDPTSGEYATHKTETDEASAQEGAGAL